MSTKRAEFLKSSKKFGFPLFCGAWAAEKSNAPGVVILAGGGGEGRHGIKSKIILAQHDKKADELSDEVFSFSTGTTPAFKLAVHPNGEGVLAAFSNCCKLFDLVDGDSERSSSSSEQQADESSHGVNASGGGWRLVESERALPALGWLGASGAGASVPAAAAAGGEGEGEEEHAIVPREPEGEVKCIVFSADGSRLAAGGEDGRLRVFEWPSMEVAMVIPKAHTSSLKDADFTPDGDLLVTTADAGPARVWDIDSGTAVATLSAAQGSRIGLCRFSRDPSKPLLFTTAVRGGRGYIVVWDCASWRQLGVKRIFNEPISAFAVSRTGRLLAAGTAEGDLSVVDVKSMSAKQKVRGAHLVFVTGLEFSPDSRTLLSVSGDASARVTAVTVATGEMKSWHATAILVAMVLLSILIVAIFANSDYAIDFFQFPMGRDQPGSAGIFQILRNAMKDASRQHSSIEADVANEF